MPKILQWAHFTRERLPCKPRNCFCQTWPVDRRACSQLRPIMEPLVWILLCKPKKAGLGALELERKRFNQTFRAAIGLIRLQWRRLEGQQFKTSRRREVLETNWRCGWWQKQLVRQLQIYSTWPRQIWILQLALLPTKRHTFRMATQLHTLKVSIYTFSFVSTKTLLWRSDL